MKKEKISLIYKILIVIVSAIGLVLNLKFLSLKTGMAYFTIQTNLLCFAFYFIITILYLVKKIQKKSIYYLFEGAVLTSTIFIMLIYTVLQLHGATGYEGHMLPCIFVHYIVPVLVIADYIVFESKGNIKKYYPLIWSIFLVLYGIYSTIYIKLGGIYVNGKQYAYFFLDINKYGLNKVINNFIIVYIFFLLLGLIIYYFDNKSHKQIRGDNNE